MGSFENLTNEEAINKLKELAEDARVCMFCTNLMDQPISARPMAIEEVDEEGNLWFISSIESVKNAEINEDSNVQLFFNNTGSSEYLSVYGYAKIYKDRHTIEEKWTTMAEAWFDGKNDPDVSILKVTPMETKYWDTKDGKVVTLLKIASSIITGNKDNEGGVEGNLNI